MLNSVLEVNWARGETGWSGLHYAAWCNYGDLLDLLLDQAGVNTNIKAQTDRETLNRYNRHHKSLLSNRNDTQNGTF